MNPRSSYYIGVDLGLRRDPTAIVVVEDITRTTGVFDHIHLHDLMETVLVLRWAETLPLETPYADLPDVFETLFRRLRAYVPRRLVVDATGVGLPVVENLRHAHLEATLHPIVISAGQEPGRLAHSISVPRRILLENLRAVLETQRLRIPAALPRLETLFDHLLALGHPESTAPDDLGFALALAVWFARPQLAQILPQQPFPGTPGRAPT